MARADRADDRRAAPWRTWAGVATSRSASTLGACAPHHHQHGARAAGAACEPVDVAADPAPSSHAPARRRGRLRRHQAREPATPPATRRPARSGRAARALPLALTAAPSPVVFRRTHRATIHTLSRRLHSSDPARFAHLQQQSLTLQRQLLTVAPKGSCPSLRSETHTCTKGALTATLSAVSARLTARVAPWRPIRSPLRRTAQRVLTGPGRGGPR